ncbi:hypothetical protein [Streptomyces palmae]|uniref:Uncharacterized protein n=1 Tax=Streptomyces palmae TaxID=1701085 RepID=A0A4Z0FTM1_9ACTN|nr:hypothetical protein [Streptomyces palmae]TGA85303.1 hypothetical protein E4099_30985 [Streptomyces palmae]
MSGGTEAAPEAGAAFAERAEDLKARAAKLKEHAAGAEEKARAASAWAVRLVQALGAGSTLLGKTLVIRLKGWCLEGHRSDLKGISADLGIYLRGGVLAIVGYGVWRAVDARPVLMWPLVGTWCVAALRTRVKASTKQAPEGAGEGSPTTGSGAVPGPSAEVFVHLLHDLVQEHSQGSKTTPGLHWPQVVAGLSSRYPGGGPSGGWSAADCRRLCEAAGVPTSKGVRAHGEGARPGVSTGVRTKDLPQRPPLPSPGPSPTGSHGPGVAVVSAGQIEQQGQQQQQQHPGDNTPEGEGVRIVQDEANPNRWHVVRPTPTS